MADITARITIESSDLTSNSLDIDNSVSVAASFTNGVARKTVTATAVGSSATTIYTADDYAAPVYIYIKNTDSTSTDYLYIYDDTTSGDPVILKLKGGAWAFLPTIADKTLRAYATTNPTTIEFMVFGTDQ